MRLGSVTIEISLAKFKKKQSEPTKGSEGAKKIEPKDGDTRPVVDETADETTNTNTPPVDDNDESLPKDDDPHPFNNPVQQGEKNYKLTRLFWLRIGFAVVAGIVATFAFESVEGEERRWSSIVFMIIVFIVTIFIAKGMNIPFALSDRKKLVTQGIGSYIFIYLFIWIMSYTLVNLDDANVSIPFP